MSEQPRGYQFGFIDEYAKREVRRSLFKAICIPGYQVPYSSREMPMGRGFGTGGLQITLSLIGPEDVLKVIDQGSDECLNAVNIREFVRTMCPGIETTSLTEEATIIQTRHRIPEKPLKRGQILNFQVPYPDALVVVEANEARRRVMHGEADYARLWVKLYEDLVQYGEITISHRYPTRIHEHYVIDPSPIPRYDVERLHHSEVIQVFGAGREKKIYAVPPFTDAVPLSFEDYPFRTESFADEYGCRIPCALCGCTESFLEEYINSEGERVYQCSDTDYCLTRQNALTNA